ncbi:MAG: dihydroxy-acid dehydratase [Peptococcaceae bacterium]|jgi:dihydroxy-acid dehydratase|nr:dihydroxy-acid dehydratase [Peptococcaceae bacterium]MDH7525769.1 dihydroxy-acid dehydratase [Peptococcaceae bacterium]
MKSKTELRSNFKKGTLAWASRRAHWRAIGLTDEDMEKPKIAIVNSSSSLALCFTHLDAIALRLKEEIRAAGGLAFEIRTAAPSDFITAVGRTGGYIQSTRDLIVNDIEVAVEGAQLDGMICLASCDKTAPGQLMAAARLNIPTLIIACGYQPSGKYRGEHCDIEDVFINAGHYASGKITLEELTEMTETAIQGPGVCPGFGTANSMHCVSEALGMALPGSTPVMANSSNMWKTVRLAGERIVQMVWEDVKPRDILTPEAFANAVMVMLAVSGSINTIKHLQAVAREAKCEVDVYGLFEQYASRIPLLTAVRPNGQHTIEEFEAAGGTRAVMKQLEGFLHKEARTITGQTVGEILREAKVIDETIIYPVDRALSTRPSIVLVRGSLAPVCGIVKLAVVDDRPLKFRGPAVIYESREEAIAGLKRGDVKAGEVLVLRGFGVKGNPGMGLLSSVIFALDGAGLTGEVAVVTDGHVSGLVNKTLLVCEISPEAAEGGPLALVERGDMISIDVKERVVNLEVPEDELASRRARMGAWPTKDDSGWLSIYRRVVRPLSDGAVLVE